MSSAEGDVTSSADYLPVWGLWVWGLMGNFVA